MEERIVLGIAWERRFCFLNRKGKFEVEMGEHSNFILGVGLMHPTKFLKGVEFFQGS
jgi:hypothetical protein